MDQPSTWQLHRWSLLTLVGYGILSVYEWGASIDKPFRNLGSSLFRPAGSQGYLGGDFDCRREVDLFVQHGRQGHQEFRQWKEVSVIQQVPKDVNIRKSPSITFTTRVQG